MKARRGASEHKPFDWATPLMPHGQSAHLTVCLSRPFNGSGVVPTNGWATPCVARNVPQGGAPPQCLQYLAPCIWPREGQQNHRLIVSVQAGNARLDFPACASDHGRGGPRVAQCRFARSKIRIPTQHAYRLRRTMANAQSHTLLRRCREPTP